MGWAASWGVPAAGHADIVLAIRWVGWDRKYSSELVEFTNCRFPQLCARCFEPRWDLGKQTELELTEMGSAKQTELELTEMG